MTGLWIAALAALLLAGLLLWWGGRQQRAAGLPRGRVSYADPKLWGRPEKPFYDVDSALTGKPDYLVAEGGKIIPVEVKSSRAPTEPYEGHLLQLFAYCLLVERATGQRPSLPTRIGDLFEREERMVELPGDYAAIADFVATHAVPRG